MTTRHTRILRGLVVTGLSLAAAGGLTAAAPAATPATAYDALAIDTPDPQTAGRWGERTAMAGDIDGDGVNDFFAASPFYSSSTTTDNNRGRVYLISGKTRQVLYRIDSPQPQDAAAFGFYISAFGDANGDGKTDVAVGTDAQTVGANSRQGKAWVFSGANGDLLYALDNPDPQADGRFGSRIGTAGDVTGDGVRDLLVGASNNDLPAGCGNVPVTTPPTPLPAGCHRNLGQAYIFNGASGALVRRLNVPANDVTALGSTSTNGSFGIAVQSPGDTNGDGRADLYANGFTQDGPAGPGQGRAWIFNGSNGALIRQLDDPAPTDGGQFGWSLAATDYNKDGVADQYIGQSPHHVAGSDDNGGTYVLDGRDGSLLKAFELPAPDSEQGLSTPNGPRLGWTVSAAGDLNGDGEPDYIAGAPFTDVGGTVDQGRLWIFQSRVAPAAQQGPGPAPQAPNAAAKSTSKLSIARATVDRRARVLDVLAPITGLASGRVNVALQAAGRTFRVTAPIDSGNGRIRFRKAIPAAQARLGTGILTITYAGDADTRPQTVRLRAANRPAGLQLARPRIVDGRVQAAGSVSSRARGVVRMEIEYVSDATTRVLRFQAPIRSGRWSLDEKLSDAQLADIARRSGTVHSYTLFTGYLRAGMRGEMRTFQAQGER